MSRFTILLIAGVATAALGGCTQLPWTAEFVDPPKTQPYVAPVKKTPVTTRPVAARPVAASPATTSPPMRPRESGGAAGSGGGGGGPGGGGWGG